MASSEQEHENISSLSRKHFLTIFTTALVVRIVCMVFLQSWSLSNSLESLFCVEALEQALRIAKPQVFNTDQGSQFTSRDFSSRLEQAQIAIGMDGRGRVFDDVFSERLWQTVKYEEVYPPQAGLPE